MFDDEERFQEAKVKMLRVMAVGVGIALVLTGIRISLLWAIAASLLVGIGLWAAEYELLRMSPHYPPD